MSASDLVSGALQDFDSGVLISIPAMQDIQHFERYESSRTALFGHLSSNKLAPRYGV